MGAISACFLLAKWVGVGKMRKSFFSHFDSSENLVLLIILLSFSVVFLSYCATVTKPKAAESVPSPPEPDGDTEMAALPDVYIEVNIPATQMTVYENGRPKFVKPVAIGQGVYPTPEQESSIKRIEWNPWWYPPDSGWAKGAKPTPPGSGNPLGLVKMPLSQEILFHGTNKANSIGHAASHGCMRMHNADATEVAWYLQGFFSQKNDPSLRDVYKKNSRTTYVVHLNLPVEVRLIYKPVVAKDSSIFLYPDYYNKLAGKRKPAIIAELLKSGVVFSCVDDQKIEELAKNWPKKGTEIPVIQLMREPAIVIASRGPVCE